MEFGKSNWRTFEQGIEKEWLLTNGIGGFASSTVIGANTRRYHGLLVAALRPPVNRHLILSKIDESATLNEKSYGLYSHSTPGHVMKGYLHLQRFVMEPLPAFIYSFEDVFIEKKVCMVYGKNTTVVSYRIINGNSPLKLRLTPLVNFRDYHFDSHRDYMHFDRRFSGNNVEIIPYNLNLGIKMYCSNGVFVEQDNCFFMDMEYPVERERGLHPVEDHYIPGYYEVDVEPGEDRFVTVIATVEDEIGNTDGAFLIEEESKRMKNLAEASGFEDDFARKLVTAADNFIVYRRSTGGKTIIAGYPWFTDWGRDTMIALPGLTLVTGRFQDAREILYTFSRYVKDGLIPNKFPDEGEEPIYNTVDAPLWYFEAVQKYLEYTGDYDFVFKNIYPALKEIVNAYIKGTHFNIKMDDDYLVSAGEMGTQLTWMDAKIGDWVVTPRHGKAVEINALWYNALRVMSGLACNFGDTGGYYDNMAEGAKKAFCESFWNEGSQCLYDVISDENKDGRVRPNQIIAISLTYPVLEGYKAEMVVERVWKELYTAYGLRSLSPESHGYKGIYAGDQYNRDSAYHQGTVWTWPLGHFITAYLRVNNYSPKSRELALKMIMPLKDHLYDACIGNISEIFDGDEPLRPRGCFAQAWSVGEILRAYAEAVMRSGS